MKKTHAMSNQQPDILRAKQNRLGELTAQADRAVEMVSRTISSLELINQEINDTVTEIETYTAQLLETRDKLARNQKHNAAIIANFTKLLSVDDADEAPEKENA